jgi:hypothetical protein
MVSVTPAVQKTGCHPMVSTLSTARHGRHTPCEVLAGLDAGAQITPGAAG